MSSQPFLLNTCRDAVKSAAEFTDQDRIAVPSVKVSVQAVVLQMAAARLFGDDNYSKLDKLTVSMTPPDATLALMAKSGAITASFSVPPFQTQQLSQPGIHTYCRPSTSSARISHVPLRQLDLRLTVSAYAIAGRQRGNAAVALLHMLQAAKWS